MRFPSADDAALAAANEIGWQNRARGPQRGVEWSFNIFRDALGYYPGGFYTDRDPSYVTVKVSAGAIASGHNHTLDGMVRDSGPRDASSHDELSEWDLGRQGILQAQEAAGRFLPHYLVTPSGQLRVWEWKKSERHWAVRAVAEDRRGPRDRGRPDARVAEDTDGSSVPIELEGRSDPTGQ